MVSKNDIERLNEEIKKLENENEILRKNLADSSNASPYKVLAEKSKDGILIIHDQIIKYVNNGFLELTGYTEEEVIGNPYNKFITEEEFAKLRSNSLRRMAGEDVLSIYDTIIKRKDSSLLKIEINVTIDSCLDKPALIVAIRDLSQFEKIKKEKEDQAQFLSTLLNALPVPVFYKNKEKKYAGCNKAFCDFTGFSMEKLLGKSAFEVFPEKEAKFYENMDNDLLQAGEEKVIETKLQISNKSEKEIILYKQVFFDEKNTAAGIIGVFLDITESNKFRNELENKQKFLESIIHNLPLMIFTINSSETITLFEGKVLNMLELKSSELVGRSYREVLKGEIDILKNVERAFKGEIESSYDFFRGHYFETHYASMKRKNKNKALLGVSLDITDRRKAELEIQKYLLELQEGKDKLEEYSRDLEESQKDLIELNESKDKFFSIISHDLRSPFTSLIGLSDFLIQEYEVLSKEDLKDAIYSFNRNTKNIMSFLENLLSWARIQMNRQEIELTTVNLLEVVLNVLEIFKLNINNKKLVIVKNIDKSIDLFVDENMINTAVRNIVSNSIKFTPDLGTIKFEAINKGDICELKISDSGIGIDEDKLEELFKIDSIKSSPGLKGEKGTGLGLLLTKDLIEANGGSISVEGAVNKGTTFTINLPMVKKTNL